MKNKVIIALLGFAILAGLVAIFIIIFKTPTVKTQQVPGSENATSVPAVIF